MQILSESLQDTDFNPSEYAKEMVEYHTEQLQACMKVYNATSKQVQKHQTMLDYYQKQLGK